MRYLSTRSGKIAVSSSEAIVRGISEDGGLFIPEMLPHLKQTRLLTLSQADYIGRAVNILGDFLTDFSEEEIDTCVTEAYGTGNFSHEKVAPVVKLTDSVYMLELWHGPTLAFKDMALQLLPHLLTASMKKAGDGKEAAILVATSGDTGKAALEGFRDVEGAKLIAFYPHGGVSDIQYLQMTTQEGENLGVSGVIGNFDDTQSAIKKMFTDPALIKELAEKNIVFSSANSINWGRLVPQIAYYVSAYCEMVAINRIVAGERINICVPTGNFGNILAAYYAKRMGLPINMLICASNVNNVLSDFIRTGVYDRRREFVLTSSPSMDILISSNLERLLYDICGRDYDLVSDMMRDLAQQGFYEIPEEAREQLQTEFFGGFCDEAETAASIRSVHEKYGYLCDTHTAVAFGVYEKYLKETGDDTKTLIVSTANPYKFADSILDAFGLPKTDDPFANAAALEAFSGMPIPDGISGLKDKTVRHDKVCPQEEMPDTVRRFLGIM